MSVRSLGTAASGIDTMQTDLDTIGNDIANSETDGFASQTAQFSDLLTEQLQPAGGAVGESLASTNPSAIGAGDEVSAIETNFSAGAVTQTGINSNVAIEGNGFLVVSQNGQTFYTLDGDLQVDSNGNLATNSGGLGRWMGNRATDDVAPDAAQHRGRIDRRARRDAERRAGGKPSVQRDESGDDHHDDVRLPREPGSRHPHPHADGP
jgi:flagellar hook-basal body protein